MVLLLDKDTHLRELPGAVETGESVILVDDMSEWRCERFQDGPHGVPFE